MKIPVILLNYNSSADCRKCVSFLQRQEGVELEIVVVDNCSRPDDRQAVETLCREQRLTYIPASENRGYNAGNNIGLRYAAAQGYEYALIANPDMEFPQTDYVARLADAIATRPDVAVAASDILTADGKHQNPWEFSKWWMDIPLMAAFAATLGISRQLPLQNGYCDIVSGCCLIVRLDVIRRVGYFDENVFLYCEEAILGKQVRQQGKRVYYIHNITAIHRHIESAKGSFRKRYNAFWKSRWYYLKNYSGFNKLQLAIIYMTCPIGYWAKIVCLKIRGIE